MREFQEISPIMMPCISKKFSVNNLSSCLVLVFLLNNLHCSTSALSTTVPSVLSSNFSSLEPSCSNVKDLFSQRGIADKDLPAKFPIKGENCFKFTIEFDMETYKKLSSELKFTPGGVRVSPKFPLNIDFSFRFPDERLRPYIKY